MTKDRIKFYIDNYNELSAEIGKVLENVEIQNSDPNNIINELYNLLLEHGKDVVEKYNFDTEALKILYSFQDIRARNLLLGVEEGNKLLRDIIDIYGDEAYHVLGCDYYGFEMSDIDGILLGEDNQQYKEFYKKVLKQKCSNVTSLEELSNILLSTKPEYVTPDVDSNFLDFEQGTPINTNSIMNFIEQVPAIAVDGNVIKKLVGKTQVFDVYDESIEVLKRIQV